MLPSLPSLTPRDSYSLWYQPTHNTSIPSLYNDTTTSTQHHHDPFLHSSPQSNNNQNQGPRSSRSNHQHALYRTPLSRLAADELYQSRRKANIQNYGNSWLRPPGVPKSLYQLREEAREMKEHAEAMRREALAQELADAEAAAQDELMVPDEEEEEEVRDLDDDIPSAEGLGGLDDDDDDDEDSDDEDLSDIEVSDEEEEEADRTVEEERMRIVTQRIEHGGFGMDGLGPSGSESGDENEDQMLQEEDLVHEEPRVRHMGDGDMEVEGMDMDVDMDDEVPDAGIGGYEHTDTEEEDSSSDGDESVDVGRLPLQQNFVSSMVRSDGTQNSLDLRSGSLMESSPRQRASRNRRG